MQHVLDPRKLLERLDQIASTAGWVRKLPVLLGFIGLTPIAVHAQQVQVPGGAAQAPAVRVAPPQIDNLSATTLERSGRLIVLGSNFGAAQGSSQVVIDGFGAIVTSWTGDEIHAYVPEQASLGSVDVQVRIVGRWSNTVPLDVTLRQPDGQVRWRFQMDASVAGRYLATAANGTVYASDNTHMYALAADGGLLWAQPAAGGGLPISVAADGTIYTWRGGMVALAPSSGAVDWFYPSPSLGKMLAGPNRGPDGNLYGVQEVYGGGLGVFSIDPAGQLRWSDTSLGLNDLGGAANSEIAFARLADDRFAFGTALTSLGAVPTLHAYDFSGQLQWEQSSPCNSFPASDSMGRFLLGGTSILCGVTALDRDGQVAWNAPPPMALSLRRPAVAPNDTAYAADPFSGRMWAVWPDGTTKWFVNPVGWVQFQGVSPDDSVIVAGGYAGTGTTGSIRGFDTTDGALRWLVSLPFENGSDQMYWSARPSFSADSSTAYVTTRFTGSGTDYSYVYAVATP